VPPLLVVVLLLLRWRAAAIVDGSSIDWAVAQTISLTLRNDY
jgi:hypothetical protein